MSVIQQITMNGKPALGVEVDFEIGREAWNEYLLLDGGKIRVKCNVIKILQVVNKEGQPILDSDGDPVYCITTRNDVVLRT